MNRKIKGGALALVGYILSPLSWWNDLVINIPIAYMFAFPFGFISNSLFLPMMILGYWITNIAGLILLHRGVRGMVRPDKDGYARKDLIRDITVSILYSLVVVALALTGWLAFPFE